MCLCVFHYDIMLLHTNTFNCCQCVGAREKEMEKFSLMSQFTSCRRLKYFEKIGGKLPFKVEKMEKFGIKLSKVL